MFCKQGQDGFYIETSSDESDANKNASDDTSKLSTKSKQLIKYSKTSSSTTKTSNRKRS